MARHYGLIPAILCAALLSACGGSDDPSPADRAPAPSGGSGGLRVGATDIRLGDATSATQIGSEQLRVRRRPNPDTLQNRGGRREGVGAGASCENTEVVPSASNMDVVVASTLCLLNGERADAGLGPLAENGRLAQAALAHSSDMVEKQYFDHKGADGSDPVDRIRSAGYIPDSGSWTVGENLAWGTGSLATPRDIVAAWMKSQGHRENILRGAFEEIGFGVAIGNPRSRNGQGATYTTTFGGTGAGRSTASGTTAAIAAENSAESPAVKGSSNSKKSKRKRCVKRKRKGKRCRPRRR